MSEPSIGELIAEALRSSSIMKEALPQPLDADQIAHEQMVLAGQRLSGEIASHYGLSFSEAWDALCHVPNHMLGMLDTPYGWTALGEYVAAALNVAGIAPLIPDIH